MLAKFQVGLHMPHEPHRQVRTLCPENRVKLRSAWPGVAKATVGPAGSRIGRRAGEMDTFGTAGAVLGLMIGMTTALGSTLELTDGSAVLQSWKVYCVRRR